MLAMAFLPLGLVLLFVAFPLGVLALLMGALFFLAGTVQLSNARARIAAADAEALRSWQERRRR